jgi:hypothetical protein
LIKVGTGYRSDKPSPEIDYEGCAKEGIIFVATGGGKKICL